MRLRILQQPTGTIDGVSLLHFQVGETYEVGTEVACVFLAEQWAELVCGDGTDVFVRSSPADVANIAPVVLVVDDDLQTRTLTETILTTHGYHVVVAAHGKDAIQRLRQRCPSLIVLDLMMPVMDGWQFRTEQRFLPDPKRATVPVLLMTGATDAEKHAENLKAVGVIKKPLDADDLLDAVSAAVESHGSGLDGIQATRRWKRM